jgi:DNA mismatch repair protein MutH
MSFTKKFNEEQKKQLREDWSEYSDGAEVPKKSTVTLEEAEFLHAQAVAISLGATIVDSE